LAYDGYLHSHLGNIMDDDYSIAQARNQLSELVHQAESGKTVKLTRRGKPVAVVVSLAAYESLASYQSRVTPVWSVARLDTVGYKFNREEVNSRAARGLTKRGKAR
jgi:prevent-host-death family protein